MTIRVAGARRRADLTEANTFGISCIADNAFELSDANQFDTAMDWFARHPDAFILGGGSNLLLTGNRVAATLMVRLRGRRILSDVGSESIIVRAAAGENWHEFVGWTLNEGFAGLENLSLIPGLCGAAPVQNIGAYGVELADRIHRVHALDLINKSHHEFSPLDCEFSYRDSLFKRQPNRWLITAIDMRVSRHDELVLEYGDIRHELGLRNIDNPNSRDVADAVCAIRMRKLPDPAALGNAGSFFKNPVVSAEQAASAMLAEIPQWAAPNGTVKLAAAALIEAAGLKGIRQGAAGIHAHHALVIVNHGGANGTQILALARKVQQTVADRFGVQLEPEPVFIHSV